MCAVVCACGGGGGGGSVSPPASTPTPTPTPTSTAVAQTSQPGFSGVGAPASAIFSTIGAGYGGTLSLPGTTAGDGPTTLGLTLANPTGTAVTSSARLPKAIGASLTSLVFVTITAKANLTFPTWPSFSFVLPASLGVSASNLYLAWYNPNGSGWTTLAGPASAQGNNTYGFAAATGPVTFTAGTTYAFVLFSTSQVLVVPTPTPTPTATATPIPTPTPTATAVASGPFACPATGTAGTASFAGFSLGEALVRRPAMRHLPVTTASATLAVTYDRSTALTYSTQLETRERQLGARLVRSFEYDRQNVVMHVLAVPAGSLAQAESTLRAQSGVLSVELSGQRRFALTSSPYYPNDPYFVGFTAGQTGTVSTYETALGEAASVPGQWDMHAIGIERAFGYVNGGTGVAATGNALGSSSIKIAIIDTGEDASHPELNSKIAYQHCYITNLSNVQSTGSFSTDELGHGTDVSGIAAAASGNSVGFTGVGGKAVIYAYRVFPTPDDNCAIEGTPDSQCSADTTDIASAIDDAVTQGVNVISMSLGGGSCTNGVDDDPDERAAIANALSHNVIVVAAAGNSSTASLDAPACISGVIAVGATGLDDGTTTGTTSYSKSVTGASASTPIEYVASYSQYTVANNNVHSATSWGIVAPGGDPSNSEVSGTPDDLHWIENIWTSTPYQSSPSDTAFTGNCNGDYPAETGTADCRTLIAGTSMATPHVAGAVALILAVNSSYQTPAAMKQLLCQTADDLHDTHQGCGRLNVYRAMATALGDTSPP